MRGSDRLPSGRIAGLGQLLLTPDAPKDEVLLLLMRLEPCCRRVEAKIAVARAGLGDEARPVKGTARHPLCTAARHTLRGLGRAMAAGGADSRL